MNQQKKKRSLKSRYMIILVGVAAAVVLVSWLAVTFCLEPYYMKQKQRTLVRAHNELTESLERDGCVTNQTKQFLRRVKETYNIEIFLWDSSQNVLYSSGSADGPDSNDLLAYILGRQKVEKQIVTTEDYQINKTRDAVLGTYYMEMFSSYDSGSFSIMRVPLQSIQETVHLVSIFQFYIGLIVAAIGIAAAWWLTKNMTKPINSLASIAEKMAKLDFTAKFQGSKSYEIDVLGQSMNDMSTQLEKTISELKSANLVLQKDIAEKTKIDEMRREFLSNVSHELKTPIALVQGYAEGLKDGINDDPESMEWYCDVIIDEAGKMNTMVKKLLTLNQIEEGREKLNLEHFDLLAMIRGVLNSYRIMITQKNAKVELRSPNELYIWADEFMAEEVIRNYVGNALNHLSGENRIVITVDEQNGKAHIRVFNTGEPIPEESLARIWDKFYKVDKARCREYGGSGIGLSIVRAVMESHGTDYGVENEKDGVCFWCEFDCKSKI